MRFFFYGTLIDAGVRRTVLGPHAPRQVEPARFCGWRRIAVPGKSYPVIIADPAGCVDGILARGLGQAARRRLAVYEDADIYELAEVAVQPAGRHRAVMALVFAGRRALALRGRSAWELEAWKRRNKRRCLGRLRRPAFS